MLNEKSLKKNKDVNKYYRPLTHYNLTFSYLRNRYTLLTMDLQRNIEIFKLIGTYHTGLLYLINILWLTYLIFIDNDTCLQSNPNYEILVWISKNRSSQHPVRFFKIILRHTYLIMLWHTYFLIHVKNIWMLNLVKKKKKL